VNELKQSQKIQETMESRRGKWRSGETKAMGKINAKMWKEVDVWNFCIIFGNKKLYLLQNLNIKNFVNIYCCVFYSHFLNRKDRLKPYA